MDGKVTVSVRSILVAVLVLLGLLTAYLLGSAGRTGTPATAAEEQTSAEPRTVAMSGTGEVTAVPDQLSFGLSIGVTRTDLDAALAEANATMKSVLRALDDHGVTKADVQTTGLSMNPVYEYHDYAPPTIVGYRVSERAHVRVSELSQGGKAITAAVDAGGNSVRVGRIRLELSDPDAVLERARDAAVKEATTKAQQYADATGQSLGDVVSLREVGAAAPRPVVYGARDLLAESAVPIRAGKDELKVSVQVVWEFQ